MFKAQKIFRMSSSTALYLKIYDVSSTIPKMERNFLRVFRWRLPSRQTECQEMLVKSYAQLGVLCPTLKITKYSEATSG